MLRYSALLLPLHFKLNPMMYGVCRKRMLKKSGFNSFLCITMKEGVKINVCPHAHYTQPSVNEMHSEGSYKMVLNVYSYFSNVLNTKVKPLMYV